MQTVTQCKTVLEPRKSFSLIGRGFLASLPIRDEKFWIDMIDEILHYANVSITYYVTCMIRMAELLKETEQLVYNSPIENKIEIISLLKSIDAEISYYVMKDSLTDIPTKLRGGVSQNNENSPGCINNDNFSNRCGCSCVT